MQERKPVSPSGRFAALARPRRQQQQQQQQQQQIMSDPPQLAALLQTIASKMTHLEGLPQQLTETRADLTANLQQLSARTIELSAHTAQTQQQVKLVQQTQEQHTTQMQQLQHQQTSLELTQQALAWDRETTLDANNELQSRGVVAVWPKKSQQQYAREQVAAELGVAVDQVEPHKKGGGFSAKLGEQAVKQKIATQRDAPTPPPPSPPPPTLRHALSPPRPLAPPSSPRAVPHHLHASGAPPSGSISHSRPASASGPSRPGSASGSDGGTDQGWQPCYVDRRRAHKQQMRGGDYGGSRGLQ